MLVAVKAVVVIFKGGPEGAINRGEHALLISKLGLCNIRIFSNIAIVIS